MRPIVLFLLTVAGCSGGGSGADASAPDLSAPADLAAAGDLARAADLASPGDGGGGDTWTSWASGFFASYCVSCHSPTGSDPGPKDFTQYASVLANAPEIRCGVAVSQDAAWMCAAFPPPEQFPVGTGPKPTNAERDRLVAWIGAGAPQ